MAGPLAGLRVIDLGHDWACPHAARVLADFGADVVKVEYPRRLDGMRGGERAGEAYNRRPRFHQLNRNKRSVALDLDRPADREALADLVRRSDVLMANARAGVLDRLGFGRDVLFGLKPDLIVLSMTAFGETGPDAAYAGYGGTIEALSGIQSLTAYDRGGAPRRIREMDVTNGILGACAVATALAERSRTGRGRWIDFSELEAATSALIGEHLLEHAVNGALTLPVGNRHPAHAPHGCYRCLGEDRWVVVAVTSEREWAGLCRALGHPEWERDPRFATAEGRRASHDALDALLEAWTRARTPQEAMERLQAEGVPAGAVLGSADLVADPHLAARGFFVEAQDASGRYSGFPVQFEHGGGEVRRRGPDLGADSAAVRCGLLGRPAAEIEPLEPERLGTAFDEA
jgi:crotonobetainyl-CoA:carnitine CoA-transferase CaiB-like acyl-CoA transferase